MLETLEIYGEAQEVAGKDYRAGKDVPKDVLHPCYYPLLECPYFGNVRRFQLGDVGPLERYTSAELLVPLVETMPVGVLTIPPIISTRRPFKVKRSRGCRNCIFSARAPAGDHGSQSRFRPTSLVEFVAAARLFAR